MLYTLLCLTSITFQILECQERSVDSTIPEEDEDDEVDSEESEPSPVVDPVTSSQRNTNRTVTIVTPTQTLEPPRVTIPNVASAPAIIEPIASTPLDSCRMAAVSAPGGNDVVCFGLSFARRSSQQNTSSDGESNDDDLSSGDDADLEYDDKVVDLPPFPPQAMRSLMGRRLSLPVSCFSTDSRPRKSSTTSTSSMPSQFQLRAQRRHSLPAPPCLSTGIEIFNELSSQLDTVAEGTFNEDTSEHYGEKVTVKSINPGALPDAEREALKLTNAHGFDSLTPDEDTCYEHLFVTPQYSSSPKSTAHSLLSAYRPSSNVDADNNAPNSYVNAKHLLSLNLLKNFGIIDFKHKKIQRLLGNPQHSVLIGRERRAVSIPTHFRLKSILLGLEASGVLSRRVSMGDQPIFLDSSPLLRSPTADVES